jgi:O-antigen/teichoic acid export membrane protein
MRLKDAIIRSILQQNATLLIAFLSGLVIARLISPAEFGAYSVAMALLNIGAALRDFGVGTYVVSSKELEPDLLGSAFGISMACATGVTLLFIVLSWPVAALYGDPALGEVLRIAAPAALVLASVMPATTLLTRELRFDILLKIGVAGAAIQAAVAIALAWAGYGAPALGWGVLAGAFTIATLTLVYRPPGSGVVPSLRGWRRLLGFGGLMSATMLVGTTSAQTPQIFIGKGAGLAEAALFSRAQNIVTVILNSFFFALMKPMLSGLAQAERDGGDMTPLYLRVVAAVTGLAWPCYAVLIVWGEPVIRLLYGSAWSAAGQMILPLALAHALTLAVAPHYDVLIVRRRVRLLLLSESLLFVVTATALALALRHGAAQPVWALTLGGLVFAAWYFAVLKSVLGFRAAALLAVWVKSLVAALAVLPPSLALRHIVQPETNLATLSCLAASAGAGGLLWLVAIRLCHHELWRHVEPWLRLPARRTPPRQGEQPT